MLLALAAAIHPRHSIAQEYWEEQSAPRAGLCRVTSLALLRHLTNPLIMQSAVLTSKRAWEEFERWLAVPEVVFLNEPDGFHRLLGSVAASQTLGQSAWTDAYLAAFCICGNYRLVSFDGGLARSKGVQLLHLRP